MSQHDMEIANQAGASFRADLNDALKALASTNSGPSQPTTPFPYQLWADATTGVLKMRSADNTIWISLARMDPYFGLTKAGMIMFHTKSVAPSGFLKCNGAAISRTTFGELFSEIGTTFGAGDGSTTFNVPDLRAEFIRGWDDSRGVDSGRAFGSGQGFSVESHNHLYGGTAIQFAPGANGSLVTGNTYSTSFYGGSETRPRNVALLACIKI
ncbi:phage tail protein [Cupriavidus sp. H18C2]|uniref:phage tail protein n=1 Tax=Cupriavidus sp. H18C2 TaxID=3241602 RepID=UPI003BF798D1